MKLPRHAEANREVAQSYIDEANYVLSSIVKRKLSVVMAYLKKRENIFTRLMRLSRAFSRHCREFICARRHRNLYRGLREELAGARTALAAA
jgi:hypothetical protein